MSGNWLKILEMCKNREILRSGKIENVCYYHWNVHKTVWIRSSMQITLYCMLILLITARMLRNGMQNNC